MLYIILLVLEVVVLVLLLVLLLSLFLQNEFSNRHCSVFMQIWVDYLLVQYTDL